MLWIVLPALSAWAEPPTLDEYACVGEVETLVVRVVDAAGEPHAGAEVRHELYQDGPRSPGYHPGQVIRGIPRWQPAPAELPVPHPCRQVVKVRAPGFHPQRFGPFGPGTTTVTLGVGSGLAVAGTVVGELADDGWYVILRRTEPRPRRRPTFFPAAMAPVVDGTVRVHLDPGPYRVTLAHPALDAQHLPSRLVEITADAPVFTLHVRDLDLPDLP